jgi:DNA-binding IscR family transcriptional regulator
MFKKTLLLAVRILKAIDNQPGITVLEIADEINISHSYVEQLIATLRECEYVVGKRGPGGGYNLADGIVFMDICLSDLANDFGLGGSAGLVLTERVHYLTLSEIIKS